MVLKKVLVFLIFTFSNYIYFDLFGYELHSYFITFGMS